MNSPPEVVITGMGVVSPIGIGRAAFRDALFSGRSGVRRIEGYDSSKLPIDFGGEVADFEGKLYVHPRKSLKVMSREIQFGFAAADLAMADANLAAENVDADRFGAVYGSDMIYCEADEVAAAYRASIADGKFDFERWGESALPEMFPLWMLKYLPNMAACHVSISLNARGPSNSITLGEVSSLVAIQEATRIIQRGAADVMIAGGASNRLHPNVVIFREQRLMSRRGDDPAAACRPFDRDRDGMVAGEGAGAIVLESRAHAQARGARILARVLGFGNTFTRPKKGEATPDAARRSMEVALREGQLSPSEIGHVNASGLSTIEHDQAEAAAIAGLLGNVPVTAPKSQFGNLGAATGAVELAASLVALAERSIPATINYDTPDPACAIHVVHGQPAPMGRSAALVLNQSPQGQAMAMLIDMP
jgi:3-oxoacyl-[acyl-carrier-protein] synthase II